MLHPDLELKWINDGIGYGVFARRPIARGVVIWAQDALDIVLPAGSPLADHRDYAALIERYCVLNGNGQRVIAWDHGKYINHCCHYNTLTTGYGFEIAVRDIAAGEEITDDYGVFNLEEPVPLACHFPDCRTFAYPDDYDRMQEKWDADIRRALSKVFSVPQPLYVYIDPQIMAGVRSYLLTGSGYRSVSEMRLKNRS